MTSSNLFDITNRVVVITGGMGQLGLAFTSALVKEGARVAILDLTEDLPEGPLDAARSDDRLITIAADVTDRSAMEKTCTQIFDKWGSIAALVNNAALDSPPNAPASENGPFETYPEASLRKIMDVNVIGTVIPTQVFGAAMAQNDGGSIVNIGSIYGTVSPDQTLYDYRRQQGEEFYKPVAYSVSKSAILNFTRYSATYWAKQGIRVNTLTFAGIFNNQDEDFLRAYCGRIPIGRMAAPNDYIGPLFFLLSDASLYMTGANLIVDGGWTAI